MLLTVDCSPHTKSKASTKRLMLQVLIALLPAVVASTYFFGQRAILLIMNCTLTAIITEEVILKIRKKPSELKNYSSALTGLLLALMLPPSTKWYAATIGSIVSILIGKHIFGGLGSNIFNPALVGRAFLMAAYPKMLTTFIKPLAVDSVSGATPLVLRKFSQTITPTTELFIGKIGGSLGETSALCLIIGGVYLLIKQIADWRIPISFLGTIALISSIFFLKNPAYGSIWFHLFGGGLLLGAFFMATDPVTTPVSKSGRYLFGVGAGLLTMIIRYFSGLPEGVMYSILFMNALTPLINRYVKSRRFGI